MNFFQKIIVFALRLSMGWLFFYAGYTKIINPEWSAEGYIKGAANFTGFFAWLSSPGVIGVVNFVNAWGLTLLGVSLILGLGMRWSTKLGALLMILYYAALPFPMPNNHAFIVDEHIIYALALLLLGAMRADLTWGLAPWFWRGKLGKFLG